MFCMYWRGKKIRSTLTEGQIVKSLCLWWALTHWNTPTEVTGSLWINAYCIRVVQSSPEWIKCVCVCVYRHSYLCCHVNKVIWMIIAFVSCKLNAWLSCYEIRLCLEPMDMRSLDASQCINRFKFQFFKICPTFSLPSVVLQSSKGKHVLRNFCTNSNVNRINIIDRQNNCF